MEEIKLNETPVRTAKNYNINNIKLDNINIPKNIGDFKNVNIIIEKQEAVKIDEKIDNINIKYGVGNILLEQLKNNSNKKIKINIEEKTNPNVEINFKFDKDNINLIENIEIIAGKESKSNIIIRYEADEDIKIFHNALIKLVAKESSNINLTIVNLLNLNSNNFITIDNEIETEASLNYYIIDFGGKNSITNYYSNMIGENSKNNLKSIYLGRENQLFDLNYIVELYGEKAKTDIDVKGALKDKSIKHFKGTIDFKKGCKKASGDENEECLLLSDEAKSVALPMLLCSEEDVLGNHSTSTGKVGNSELFYIMSRGFSHKETIKLLVKAKFNKIIENLPNEMLKNEILYRIDELLN